MKLYPEQRKHPFSCQRQNSVMRLLYLLFGMVQFIVVISGCSKDRDQSGDCNKLQQAIVSGNPDEVETEINKICVSLTGVEDSRQGLETLTNKISSFCNINAEALCYNCIYTMPGQSEIMLSFMNAGVQKNKIIDIIYSDNKFSFRGMHN